MSEIVGDVNTGMSKLMISKETSCRPAGLSESPIVLDKSASLNGSTSKSPGSPSRQLLDLPQEISQLVSSLKTTVRGGLYGDEDAMR